MDVGLVCDSCSAFNPMGAKACARCGTGLSLDATGAARASTQQSMPEERPCPTCRAPVPVSYKFCGACGHPMQDDGDGADGSGPARAARPTPAQQGYGAPGVGASAQVAHAGAGMGAAGPVGQVGKKTIFFGAMQASRAKLVLIKGDGLDGISFTLAGEEHKAGRIDCPLLFDEDPFLSPTHADFFYRDGQLVVRDESSANGIYIRLRGSAPVEFGDRFLIGEQLLEVEETPNEEPEPSDDGTYFFASPRRPSHFKIVQALRGGETGLAYRSQSDVVSLGREGNDINFPDDPFISGHHAQVSWAEQRLTLTDLNSKNGTFLRINGERTLKHGDYVFMGQQLLRVEIV